MKFAIVEPKDREYPVRPWRPQIIDGEAYFVAGNIIIKAYGQYPLDPQALAWATWEFKHDPIITTQGAEFSAWYVPNYTQEWDSITLAVPREYAVRVVTASIRLSGQTHILVTIWPEGRIILYPVLQNEAGNEAGNVVIFWDGRGAKAQFNPNYSRTNYQKRQLTFPL